MKRTSVQCFNFVGVTITRNICFTFLCTLVNSKYAQSSKKS